MCVVAGTLPPLFRRAGGRRRVGAARRARPGRGGAAAGRRDDRGGDGQGGGHDEWTAVVDVEEKSVVGPISWRSAVGYMDPGAGGGKGGLCESRLGGHPRMLLSMSVAPIVQRCVRSAGRRGGSERLGKKRV